MAPATPQAPVGAYVASTCVVGVFTAVILSRSTLGDLGEAIIYWAAYALTCGILVNARLGTTAGKLLVYSVPSPTVLIAVFIFEIAFNGYTHISGKEVTLQSPALWWQLALIWLLSVTAIWIFSFARELVLLALTSIFSLSNERAGRIETTLNWLVRVVGVAGLLVRALVK